MQRDIQETPLARAAIHLAEWFEHWFPDAFTFALIAVSMVFVLGLAVGNGPLPMAEYFGGGLWRLVPFTMQMVMIIISGYALATSPPINRVIRAMAGIPRSPRGAIAFIALFSMLSSLLSWSFSLIFSGLLTREVAARHKGVDYRAAGAAAYLELGSVWALGLSSSAALLMARERSIPEKVLVHSGVIPYSQTIFTWQSLVMAAVLVVVSMAIAWFSAPAPENAVSAESMGVPPHEPKPEAEPVTRPAEKLDRSPVLTLILVFLGGAYLWSTAAGKGAAELFELNNYILAFLLLGLLLHWQPRSFMQAVVAASPAAAGVLIQYPLYSGASEMITSSGLAERMAHFFVEISNAHTFPLLVGIYSAVLGLFVPSAGGKWLIEAPYVMSAANQLQVNLGWVVQTYNAAEALPNLIHPFWMLPLIGILKVKARDLIGYSALQFVVHVPVVLFLVWALNLTLPYTPPIGVPQ